MAKEAQPPPQHQERRPGIESEMSPRPEFTDSTHRGSGKLDGKVALITGGDSGIGRAVAIAFAREGANVALLYLNEHEDANERVSLVEREGRLALAVAGDVGDPDECRRVVREGMERFGRLDILVNNAAEQYPQESIVDISPAQLERTFRTNIVGCFFMTQAALPHLKAGAAIINAASVTAYHGSHQLLDYASTKGAIVAFTPDELLRPAVDQAPRAQVVVTSGAGFAAMFTFQFLLTG